MGVGVALGEGILGEDVVVVQGGKPDGEPRELAEGWLGMQQINTKISKTSSSMKNWIPNQHTPY